jgi:uncharacterized protein YjiK
VRCNILIFLEMKSIFKIRYPYSFVLICIAFGTSCNKSNPTGPSISQKELVQYLKINLPFTKPSGIAFSEALQKLWIVSGGTQRVYMLDTNGNVEKLLNFNGTDLEGITFDATDSTLWVIDESTKEISHLDLGGNVLMKKQILYDTKHSNKGPEGITIGPGHLIYIVNEQDPSLLLKLDNDYKIVTKYQLDFASDYSDIAYDSLNNSFYILSDESKAFFLWNESQGAIYKYVLPETKNEGITFNQKSGVFYIVNDSTAQLSIYKIKN